MASWRSVNPWKIALAVVLAVSLLGVAPQACAAMKSACKADCCLPTPACLSLDFNQAPASAPDAAPTAPATKLFLLAVLTIVAVFVRMPALLGFAPLPVRSDPERRRAPSRAQLHSWTL